MNKHLIIGLLIIVAFSTPVFAWEEVCYKLTGGTQFCFNTTYVKLAGDRVCTEGNGLCSVGTGDNASWNQSYAGTLYAPISTISDNTSWNQSYASTLYAAIGTGGNTSFNQSLTDTLYYPKDSNPLGYYNSSSPPPLSIIGNPTENKTFTMTTRNLEFTYTTGTFSIEQTGATNNDLVHIHQHTGNPLTGSDLLHLEATDADVVVLNATGTRDTIAYFIGNISVDGNKVCTSGNGMCGAGSSNLTLGQVNTNIGNWSAEKGSLPNLSYANIANNIGNFSANGYTRAQIDTLGNWSAEKSSLPNLSLANINANMGNASKHVASCSAGYMIQNITSTGVQCVADSVGEPGAGDISDVLQGQGIIVTTPGGPQPNVSINWTEVGANLGNWSGEKASLPNLTLGQIASNIGNYSANSAGYVTGSYVSGAVGQNLTYALINSNMGNWSSVSGNYYTKTQVDTLGNFSANGYTKTQIDTLGNWSADKLGQNNGTSNLTLGQVATNMGNWSADSGNYATKSYVGGAVGQNLTYALVVANIGNYSASISAAVGQNLTYALVAANLGNFSANNATLLRNSTDATFVKLSVTNITFPQNSSSASIAENTTCLIFYSPNRGSRIEVCN